MLAGTHADAVDWQRSHANLWKDGVIKALEEPPDRVRSAPADINKPGQYAGGSRGRPHEIATRLSGRTADSLIQA